MFAENFVGLGVMLSDSCVKSRAITQNRFTGSVFSQKRVHSETKKKTHPTSQHAISDFGEKHIVPVYQPFTEDNDPQAPLPAANYDVFRFSFHGSSPAGITSGRIMVPKPLKLSVVERVCFYVVWMCACFVPYTLNTEIAQQS